ncbi:MAG TPA: hypothetical protein VGI03_08380 [Verrucomicrobiae bacterium]|jgi:Spy/CpxP family protein refolding chaperone
MNLNRKNIIAMLAVGGSLAFGPALLAQDSTSPSTNTPPANVQGGQMRGQSVDQMLQRLTTRLSLTADEQTKVKPILQSQIDQIGAVRKDSSLSSDDARAKMKAIRQDIMNQMQAVLTPDQFTQYQQMAQRGRRPGGAGGTNAPAATPPPPQQ